MDDRDVDAAIISLSRWAAAAKTTDAVDRRRRQELLQRVSEDEATLADVAAGLAERRAEVAIRTRAGATHRGALVAAGADFLGVVSEHHLTLLSLAAVGTIRPAAGGAIASGSGRQPPTASLGTVLSGLADDGVELRVVTASETLTGEIVAVGEDVVTLRLPAAARDEVIYVALDAIYEASLRLSG